MLTSPDSSVSVDLLRFQVSSKDVEVYRPNKRDKGVVSIFICFSTTGKHVSRLRPGAVLGRVTGLDPAGAHYNYVGAADRLDSTDATFVDVMYTDSIVTSIFIIVGHVSYYPNGGVAPQNGCVVGKLRLKSFGKRGISRTFSNLATHLAN